MYIAQWDFLVGVSAMSGIDEQDRYEERLLEEEKELREELLRRVIYYDAVSITYALSSAEAGDVVFQDEDPISAYYRGLRRENYDVVE